MTDIVINWRNGFEQYVNKLAGRMDELAKHVAYKLAQSIIVGSSVSPGTPRDTSFAANSWVVSPGGPGAYRQPPENKAGAPVDFVALSEGLAALEDYHGDSEVWITSNCAYMSVLERGHSQKAPQGMIALTVNGLRQLVDEVAAEMRS